MVAGFEALENDARAFEDFRRKPGEFGDLDAVTVVGAAFDDPVEEHDLIIPLADSDVQVLGAFEFVAEIGEFVVARPSHFVTAAPSMFTADL